MEAQPAGPGPEAEQGRGVWVGVVVVLVVMVILLAAVFGGLFAPPARLHIDVKSGDGQSGGNNTTLSKPFAVKVSDEFHSPVEGVRVEWTLTSPQGFAGAFLSNNTTVTDAEGLAKTTLTLGWGEGEGVYTITATLAGEEESVTFTATKTP